MSRRAVPITPFDTVRDCLQDQNVDMLMALAKLLPETPKVPRRKPDLVALLSSSLSGAPLERLWRQLEERERNVLAEAAHATGGHFDGRRFQARYGDVSLWRSDGWYERKPARLRLFFHPRHRDRIDPSPRIPSDLMASLAELATKPEEPSLPVIDNPTVEDSKRKEPAPGKWRQSANKKRALEQRNTERGAQQEVISVLNLIERGAIRVGPKTGVTSATSMSTIIKSLDDGDLYDWGSKESRKEMEVGPIKAYAWPMLLQNAKLAEVHGSKLALTAKGRKALQSSPPNTLKAIWERWERTSRLDEFNRVESIRGQTGKGKRRMTDPAERRELVLTALAACPQGRWVHFDDFSCYVRAAGYDFEISRDLWTLYIGEQRYGALGYAGFGEWHILQDRYMLALLMEYVTTLGAIDILYEPPEDARPDFDKLWGVDDLAFLSRYDGLRYFRVNALGAYLLGNTPEYQPVAPATRIALTVTPNLKVRVDRGEPTPEEERFLETWGQKDAANVWELSDAKALNAVENGAKVEELRTFLQERESQPLPEKVEGFLGKIEIQGMACSKKGLKVLIECASPDIADMVAANEATRTFCMRAGEKGLLVSPDKEASFRKALHSLGYGMPYV